MKNKSANPWFWIIAGPNGAGKSTWTQSPAGLNLIGSIPLLNPDTVKPPLEGQIDVLNAGRQVLAAISEYCTKEKSFAIETTLAGKNYLHWARKLKNEQWNIGCVYVGLDSVEYSIKRVAERILKGGHEVPVEDIIRRYPRSLENLGHMFNLCDYLAVFDNSERLELLLEAEYGKLFLRAEILPRWLQEILDKASL